MKITAVNALPIDRYLFVQIETDAGITGLGESGTWGHLEASQAALEKFAAYLVGEDPSRIEHHWNVMYRTAHFRGSAIMGALSAIDIALWDIKGKEHGVPVYDLLGGKCRDKRAGLLPRLRPHHCGASARLRGSTREGLYRGGTSQPLTR